MLVNQRLMAYRPWCRSTTVENQLADWLLSRTDKKQLLNHHWRLLDTNSIRGLKFSREVRIATGNKMFQFS